MKNIKNTIAAAMLTAVLLTGTTFAKDGMLLSDLTQGDQNQCSQSLDNGGIIVAGFTGIIVAGFTGIIVAGLGSSNDSSRTSTGSCRDGMLLSD